MSIDINVDGIDVNVALQSPVIAVDIQSPELLFDINLSGTDIQLALESPVLDFDIKTPQLLYQVTGMGVVAGLAMIWGETPTGTIDGTNLSFGSANVYSPGLLAVFLNGLRLRPTNDYSETGNQTFQLVSAPLPGDSLTIDYMQP